MDGYSIQHTSMYPSRDGSQSRTPIHCLIYIGLPSNPQFLGPQDPQKLARHILRSYGPSGENREYLYMLDESLEHLSVCSGDAHVSDLARRCRGMESAKGPSTPHEVPGHDAKFGGTEELEEIEKEVDVVALVK
jgi:glutathione-specific gamma-glutamylcyclotransferase